MDGLRESALKILHMERKPPKWVFWTFVVVGLALPVTVQFTCGVMYAKEAVLKAIREEWGATLVLSIANGIPFLFVSILGSVRLRTKRPESRRAVLLRSGGVVGAAFAVLASSILVHVSAWISLYRGLPGSSTSGIALVLFAFFGPLLGIIGYFVGWFAVRLTVCADQGNSDLSAR